MNRPMLRKAIPFTLALAGVFAFGGAAVAAQDTQAPPQTADQNSGQRSDGQIEMDVVHALDGSAALKDDLITAATVQGEVTLSGTVSSQASSDLAASLAQHVQGVTKVTNNLKVGNVADAQAASEDGSAAAQQAADDAEAQAPADQNQAQPDQGNSAQAPPAQQPPQYPGQQYPSQNGQAQGNYPPPPPSRPQYSPYGYPPPPPPPGYGYPYPPQGYTPQQGYGPPQGYGPQQPPAPRYKMATGPVTVAQGTVLQVRTTAPIESKHAKDGEALDFTLIRDVALGDTLAIPRGATLHGVITEVKNAGAVGGSASLALRLTSLDLGGQNYPIESDQFKVKGPNKAGETVGNAVGGAVLGAIIGGIAGRGAGAAIGAGAGAAAGTAASAATPGPRAWIPAEALVTFRLAAPVTVNPVSQEEAARLAQGLYPGGPTLYRRGYYGYPYPYGYPPVYYRPYFVSGGFYYWR